MKRSVTQIIKMNPDSRTDFMTHETAVALMLSGGSMLPNSLVYTDNDPDYTPPETVLSGETFDTITEVFTDSSVVYGVGVTGKGTSAETVTRIIFPDGFYTTLVNWTV